MLNSLKAPVLGLVVGLAAVSAVFAHCQVPCGIYGDSGRFELMREHVTTIEKSMEEIRHISAHKQPNHNQLVRWVMNKETHADELAEIVTYYFMAQRIKPAGPDDQAARLKYIEEITLLHRILVVSMKAKQTVDVAHCAQLRRLIDQFEKQYTSE